MKRKSNFNSYELTRRLNDVDKNKEPLYPFKGMGINTVVIEDFITNKIHKYGMISGVML